jgi:Domain of unknown function (DUF5655)
LSAFIGEDLGQSDKPVSSPRIRKAEQTSKSRWRFQLKLASSSELDRKLLEWLRKAYTLSS